MMYQMTNDVFLHFLHFLHFLFLHFPRAHSCRGDSDPRWYTHFSHILIQYGWLEAHVLVERPNHEAIMAPLEVQNRADCKPATIIRGCVC